MSENEGGSEIIEDVERKGVEESEYLAEETDIEGLSISDVEMFLAKAEIWDNLLQKKISIAEAQGMFTAFAAPQEEPGGGKTKLKRSRRKRS